MSYFVTSIFLSAFLLFQIQPMISKYILPWFGGTPAVWSTALLFFQVLLTGGYAYAYWLIGKFKNRQQGIIHIILVGLSLGLLMITTFAWDSPITPDQSWKPESVDWPILQVLIILAGAVGIPYFLLATNSTLMQAWFNRDHPNRSPYRLYALSNIGSLLALISYPVIVEPNFSLFGQARLWSLGYVLFALLAIYGGYQTYKKIQTEGKKGTPGTREELSKSRTLVKILWGLFPACASVLLLAVTNQITQEVAAIPFLWVLPLTLYLLTFILTFQSERWYSRSIFSLGLLIISGIYIWLILWRPGVEYLTELLIYCVLLFVGCMVCHGELVKLRPDPKQLTSFYLMISIGGAIGGIFVNLIAPYIFPGYFELQWGLFACWVLLGIATIMYKQPGAHRNLQVTSAVLVTISIFSIGYYMWLSMQHFSAYSLYEVRNYYGILRVDEINEDHEPYRAYNMVHGKTNHGFQFIDPGLRREPTAYFTQDSGIGITYLNHPKRPEALKVGVLGLGVGAQTAYNQAGDDFRFYEINPAVVDLAEGEGGFFSYLSDAPGKVTVVLGDARLSLAREMERGENQKFDLLVLDAFTSDSIPVHLITSEAFRLYLQHLRPEGILAIDITNRHLDLRPVVVSLAREYELDYVIIGHMGDGVQSSSTLWAILSKNEAFIANPIIQERSEAPYEIPEKFRPWSDDYSNLFSILK